MDSGDEVRAGGPTGGGPTHATTVAARRAEGGSGESAPLLERLRHPRRDAGRALVGAALLALWLAWLVCTSLVQPRFVTDAQLREAVASGSVTAWRVVEVDETDDGPRWSEDLALRWQGTEAGLPGVDLSDAADDGATGVVTVLYATEWAPWPHLVDTVMGPDPAAYTALLRDAGVPQAAGYVSEPRLDPPDWAQWPGALLVLLTLGVLVGGPPPRRGTRWFWFWFLFPTLGVGVLAYALAEHLRPRPAGLPEAERGRALDVVDSDPPPERRPPATEPDVTPRRRSGLAGWGTSIVLGVGTLFALTVLHEVVGAWWLIRP